jgi:hypothetical protein
MVFWAGILVAAAFAWLAIKSGFYQTWAFVFNIIMSVYLAISLGPVVVDALPVAGEGTFSIILTVAAIATASFLILYGISYIFFTSQFNTSFPKVFDIIGAGFLGFLAGLLIWSFASLLVFMTPIAKSNSLKNIGFTSQFKQANISYICWWCNLVNKVVSPEADNYSCEDAINEVLNKIEGEEVKETTGRAETVDPNDAETTSPAEDPLWPANQVDTGGG